MDWKVVIFTVINFIIVVFILQRFLIKPVLKIIDARREKLKELLDDAEKDKREAKRMLSETHEKTKLEQERLRALVDKTNKDLKQQQVDSAVKLQVATRDQLRKAREDMMLERDRNLRTHQKEIVDLSANIAEQLLHSGKNETIQQQQIEEFLHELEQADIEHLEEV